PIGGVAAFDAEDGVISPGGVGYDINCGVRLMATSLTQQQIKAQLQNLVEELFRTVPTGVGKGGDIVASRGDLQKVVAKGADWAVEHGFGSAANLEYIEENGCIDGYDPDVVSNQAWERGKKQLGTLGSGNHFLEVGYVAEIFDETAAATMGLYKDQITVIIHCGSRGFGYQVCDDYLSIMDKAIKKYDIQLPDRQLACAPLHSKEGKDYFGAMRCAVNYAFANRQIIYALTEKAFTKVLKMKSRDVGMRVIYEVAHNIAKYEKHKVDGKMKKVCVHRKGATRAFAPGAEGIPAQYAKIGQPVLIPGDMGRYSYVLVGTQQAMEETFGSTCHGAGRAMSRTKAKKAASGRNIAKELSERGIHVLGASRRTLDEEISEAYKNVSHVVDACATAGISKKVAKLKPLCCIKG
ncbi:RtcB family protein, partial [candidate division KSB1 bacterium]|nr:RtcB family protein [candidate division KSB1 bacterium]